MERPLHSLRRWLPYLLPAWFAIFALATVGRQYDALGGDALIYYRASAAWLHGGNPWLAGVTDGTASFHFYALPPAVVLLSPFALLPEAWVQPVGIAIEAAAAVYVIRRLQLAWWWLLFPPLVSGVLAGNPSIGLLALLVASSPIAGGLAATLKVYAGLPLLGEGRWRAIAIAIGFAVVTIAVAPGLWVQFLTNALSLEGRLMNESNGGFSAYQYGLGVTALIGAAVLILATIDRRAAGWLAPIAIWPASQFHWATLAMPLRSPWLAAVLAVQIQGLPALAVLGYALWRVLHNLDHAHDRDGVPSRPGDRDGVGDRV